MLVVVSITETVLPPVLGIYNHGLSIASGIRREGKVIEPREPVTPEDCARLCLFKLRETVECGNDLQIGKPLGRPRTEDPDHAMMGCSFSALAVSSSMSSFTIVASPYAPVPH